MNKLILSLVLASICASNAHAGSYIELGAGFNRNLTGCTACWDDAGAGPLGAYMRAGHEWRLTDNASLGAHWMHLSQWFEGPPFSTESESSVDHLGIYIRYEF